MSTLEVNKITPSTGTTITLGDSGDTFTIPSGVTLTNNGSASGFGGITEADIWRITADLSGDQTPITSGWERADTDSQTYIGTGMSESSGTFTFPSTGKWLITFYASVINNSASDYLIALYISATTNGSSYGNSAVAYTSVDRSTAYNNASVTLFFDVTSTSTHKIQFKAENLLSTTTLEGHTSQNETYATFIRLGDT